MSPPKADFPKNVIVDTCFWFALFNKGDGKHSHANEIPEQIKRATFLIPWPTLYEVLNTAFTANIIVMQQFQEFVKRPNVKRINDSNYREIALERTFASATIEKRGISLVDMVIRLMLEDQGAIKIDYLITFNEKDFVDVLKRRQIPIFYAQ